MIYAKFYQSGKLIDATILHGQCSITDAHGWIDDCFDKYGFGGGQVWYGASLICSRSRTR